MKEVRTVPNINIYEYDLDKAYKCLDAEATDGVTTSAEKQMFIQGFLQACNWMRTDKNIIIKDHENRTNNQYGA